MTNFLLAKGWTEVPGDFGGTGWQAPTKLTKTPLVFSLQAAYELEKHGEGIWAYAGRMAVEEALCVNDVTRMETQEAERYAATGVRLGTYPNY